jgi:hypothetical protein
MINRGGGALGVLDVVHTVRLDWLPERWRATMRAYLEHGALPEPRIVEVLEGKSLRFDPGMSVAELHELAAVAAWIEAHLPRQCWGSRDQVQLWIVYLRRARGRALLASMEGSANDLDRAAAVPHARR